MLSGLALIWTVATSLGWAGFDVARKLAMRELDARALLVVMSFGQLPVFGASALLGAPLSISPSYAGIGAASIALNAAASLLYLHAVRISPLSLTIPLLGLTPALSALSASLLIGELPGTGRFFGIGLVVLGSLVLGGGRGRLAILSERGSAYMALVALLWSVSPAVDKLALRHASVAAHASVQVFGVAVVMLAVLAWRRELALLGGARRSPGIVIAAVLSGAFALATQLLALGLVLVSVVEGVKRGVGMALSVVFGRWVFDEPITPSKLAAVVLMLAGIALLL